MCRVDHWHATETDVPGHDFSGNKLVLRHECSLEADHKLGYARKESNAVNPVFLRIRIGGRATKQSDHRLQSQATTLRKRGRQFRAAGTATG